MYQPVSNREDVNYQYYQTSPVFGKATRTSGEYDKIR